MNQVNFSYEAFILAGAQLHQLIEQFMQRLHLDFEAILCPLRGGFFLSYYMSKKLQLPIKYIKCSAYRDKKLIPVEIKDPPILWENKDYLICDDIIDTGATVIQLKKIYPKVHFTIASLVVKMEGQKFADFFYSVVDQSEWVNFFWEEW